MYTEEIPTPASPYYTALNLLLEENDFDTFVEAAGQAFYAKRMGRPGLPPGRYFRLRMVGYLEGIGSERQLAWRCADSHSLRAFLGYDLTERVPHHSTISKTRRLGSLEVHPQVFTRILEMLKDAGLLKGKTLGLDATTLEANAALRTIERRESGEDYRDWLVKLARESGIETPTQEDLARLDRNRPNQGSNQDWVHPHDPEARITRGTTHLAHKLEQAVDLETGAVVATTVQSMDGGDTASMGVTLDEAEQQLEAVDLTPQEVVADQGYHSNRTMTDLKERKVRSYVSEPKRGRRRWTKHPEAQQPTYANRRRIRSQRGQQLLRKRGEVVERTFAHLLGTGGLRRVHVRGQAEIQKRLLIHTAAFNLGLLMRKHFGIGTPRGLQGASYAQSARMEEFAALFWRFLGLIRSNIMLLTYVNRCIRFQLVHTTCTGVSVNVARPQ